MRTRRTNGSGHREERMWRRFVLVVELHELCVRVVCSLAVLLHALLVGVVKAAIGTEVLRLPLQLSLRREELRRDLLLLLSVRQSSVLSSCSSSKVHMNYCRILRRE